MKLGKILLILTFSIICLAGCNPGDANSKNDIAEQGIMSETGNESNTFKSISASELPEMTAKWSEINRYTGDVDGDGADEDVILMTSAERNAEDEIIWNDGQEWVLYVKDKDLTYVLLDKYIQTGNVYFEVLDYYTNSGAEPRINVMVSTGSGFNMNSYIFDSDENVYLEETVYDTSKVTEGGTNRRFSSVPEIIK